MKPINHNDITLFVSFLIDKLDKIEKNLKLNRNYLTSLRDVDIFQDSEESIKGLKQSKQFVKYFSKEGMKDNEINQFFEDEDDEIQNI